MVEAACAKLAVQKPEPEQIVAALLAEEPFAADAVEGGEHASLELLRGREGWRAVLGVELIEERRKLFENRVHVALDSAQRMIRRHAGVEVDDGQEVGLSLWFSAHGFLTQRQTDVFKPSETSSTNCKCVLT